MLKKHDHEMEGKENTKERFCQPGNLDLNFIQRKRIKR